ncbi:hypothetical protein EVG20_g9951 [Dentipellis fragilis]|uniref:C3H1-type domain-containing protein n=1 Tax=Dentipellis fragilis TaxID=205917 RepID=A0A4Y9XUU4_9AGAM|nr:hypothetical protein EVG20_g9951 [Dentipellis fragilis]
MSTPDPPWKKKVRPCPFYSQGRCLFSDSCNFLHDVKIKRPQDTISIHPTNFNDDDPLPEPISNTRRYATTFPEPPTVTIQSPQSSVSSPRSPRMTSLLAALEDVIGPDDLAQELDSTTLVEQSHSDLELSSEAISLSETLREDVDASKDIKNISADLEDPIDGDRDAKAESPRSVPEQGHVAADEEDLPTEQGIISTSAIRRSASLDQPGSPTNGEDCDTQSFGLLSPVELSQGPPVPFPADKHDSSIHREDSIDSGYADNWMGPTPFALSPPRPYRPTSTLDLLSSPFGSAYRVLSPKLPPSPHFLPQSPIRSQIVHHSDQVLDDIDDTAPPPFSLDPDEDDTVHASHAVTVKPISATISPPSGTSVVDVTDVFTSSARHETNVLDSGGTEAKSISDVLSESDTKLTKVDLSAIMEENSSWEDSFSQSLDSSGDDDTSRTRLLFPLPSSDIPIPHAPPGLTSARAEPLNPAVDISKPLSPRSLLAQAFKGRGRIEPWENGTVEDGPIEEDPVEDDPVEDDPAKDGPVEGSPVEDSPVRISPKETKAASPAMTLATMRGRAVSDLTITARSDGGPSMSPQPSPGNEQDYVAPPAPKRVSLQIDELEISQVEDEADFLDDMYATYASTPSSKRVSFASQLLSESPTFRLGEPVERASSSFGYLEQRRRSQSPSRYPSRAFAPSPALSEPVYNRDASPRTDPPMSTMSATSSLSRERVFTRPSSSAMTSPVRDLITSFQDRTGRPMSMTEKQKGKQKEVEPGTPVDDKWEKVGSSTKVPFGFRKSSTAQASQPVNARKRHRPSVLTNLPLIPSNLSTPASGQFPSPSPSVPTPPWFKPLRLSRILEPASAPLNGKMQSDIGSSSHLPKSSISSSFTVSSEDSLSHHPLLSSASSSALPDHNSNTLINAHDHTHSLTSNRLHRASIDPPPQSAPISHSQSWRNSTFSAASLHNPTSDSYPRSSSRLSEPAHGIAEEDEYDDDDDDDFAEDYTMRNPIPHTAPASRAPSVLRSPVHAIATPKPDLIFAIASDDVEEVRRVLESGEAGPNEQIGPQSPLAFALTNDRLKHKVEIIKALLAYGAEPSSLNNPSFNPPRHGNGTASNRSSMMGTPPPGTVLENMDPATRYYINRANAAHTRKTSALIHRSFFRPLTRVRYDIVGQDHVFAQLFKALSAHSRQLAVAPIVVLLCGPSGHGKSLLARKFGSLLDVPTHTVNMTTLRSPHDLWDSYSMSPYEDATTCTLSEFLLENEGKRCVVVLDDVPGNRENRGSARSVPTPDALGNRPLFSARGDRHIDVRNVVWLGTSNIGHDVVVDYQDTLSDPSVTMTQDEYLELVNLLRPKVSDRLGASLLSRVTAVLPFVPFTEDEKMAIATEAFYSLGGDLVASLSPEVVEETVRKSLANYTTAEGARSLYRAVSSLLLDIPDAE